MTTDSENNGNRITSKQLEVGLKICGMKHPENITGVSELLPSYMGFIFWEPSKRFFNDAIPNIPANIKKVGVFVNTSIDDIAKKVGIHKLQAIQLHGNESPEFCASIRNTLESGTTDTIEIIKVFSIKDNFDFNVLAPFENVCDYYLFDTKGKLPGGNGYTFNWEALNDYPSTKPYFLSGGIGLEELDKIISFFQKPVSKYCHAIDVNSKFEIEPGLKHINKLRKLLTEYRK